VAVTWRPRIIERQPLVFDHVSVLVVDPDDNYCHWADADYNVHNSESVVNADHHDPSCTCRSDGKNGEREVLECSTRSVVKSCHRTAEERSGIEFNSLNNVRNILDSMTGCVNGSMHLGRTHLSATVLRGNSRVHVYAFASGLLAAMLHNAFHRLPSFYGTGREVLMVILDVLNVCIGSAMSNVCMHRQSCGVVSHFLIGSREIGAQLESTWLARLPFW